MNRIRLAARLDVKNNYLVKGIQLEGLRKLGHPNDFARRYYEAGIDEVVVPVFDFHVDMIASDEADAFPRP